MGMCSGLLAQCFRKDQCPAWVRTHRAQKFHSIPYESPHIHPQFEGTYRAQQCCGIPYRSSHIHPQFRGKQWKPPQHTFPRISSMKHCDVPHPRPRKGVILGSPKPSLPHGGTEEGTSSCSGPGRGVLHPMSDTETSAGSRVWWPSQERKGPMTGTGFQIRGWCPLPSSLPSRNPSGDS